MPHYKVVRVFFKYKLPSSQANPKISSDGAGGNKTPVCTTPYILYIITGLSTSTLSKLFLERNLLLISVVFKFCECSVDSEECPVYFVILEIIRMYNILVTIYELE